MALDFGWWTNFIGWVQPSGNGDLVIMLYSDYQKIRTIEENAKLAGHSPGPAIWATHRRLGRLS